MPREATPNHYYPSINHLLGQAADLQQQYERDVEQTDDNVDPLDAAVRDFVEFCRKHRDFISSARFYGSGDRDAYYRAGAVRAYASHGGLYHVCRTIPLDAPSHG